jgi:hypothetical protein
MDLGFFGDLLYWTNQHLIGKSRLVCESRSTIIIVLATVALTISRKITAFKKEKRKKKHLKLYLYP